MNPALWFQVAMLCVQIGALGCQIRSVLQTRKAVRESAASMQSIRESVERTEAAAAEMERINRSLRATR